MIFVWAFVDFYGRKSYKLYPYLRVSILIRSSGAQYAVISLLPLFAFVDTNLIVLCLQRLGYFIYQSMCKVKLKRVGVGFHLKSYQMNCSH